MSNIQFICNGDKATKEEMAEVEKLRLAGNFVRVVAVGTELWPGWESVTPTPPKPKRGRKPKATTTEEDLIGDIDDDTEINS